MAESAWRARLGWVLGGLLCLFVLAEVNYPRLAPQSQLAIFAMLGLFLCYLNRPLHPSLRDHRAVRGLDLVLGLAAAACCAYVVVQTEPLFESLWLGGSPLGDRAGQETSLDTAVGIVGLVLVLEASRRAIGWALPALAGVFLFYAAFGASFPAWLFPHRGYSLERIVAQTFLHSQGVFGTALYVMFTYVFLFVLFGTFLRYTGATGFILQFARKLFGASPGGPAKISVLSSGLMGSLSGSAVANTATTGTFTIPLMRDSGFEPEVAGGVEAAASSGGALVPPVMGAAAYMMLEIVEPAVTYLEIVRAALIPALLYYFSLFLIVHFHARRVGAGGEARREGAGPLLPFQGLVFGGGMVTLIGLILSGRSVFRAASIALVAIVLLSLMHVSTRLSGRKVLQSLGDTARDAVPLIAAAACVGVVIGVVTLTGIGTRLPSTILDLSQDSLLTALVLIMISSMVLGMGMPSVVCYLLMATLVGPVLGKLGIVPLAAHLFIFYFGMMSMVTPPVALAAYTAASIADSKVMPTAFAAFRFALVGFTLPYMFVFRPQLLMLSADGGPAAWGSVALAVLGAMLGILPLAASMAGYLFGPLSLPLRALLFLSALAQLVPFEMTVGGRSLPVAAFAGLALFAGVALVSRRGAPRQAV